MLGNYPLSIQGMRCEIGELAKNERLAERHYAVLKRVFHATYVPVTTEQRVNVKMVFTGNTSDFWYKSHGAADWIHMGGYDNLTWDASVYDEILFSGHSGFSGGIDSIVLEVIPEPATLSLLGTGGLFLLRRRISCRRR